MIYGLHEALRIVQEEGLEARWARHARAHEALRDALWACSGSSAWLPHGEHLNPLLAVHVPEGVDDAGVRGALLREDGIEIAGSLGPLAGRVWRIGVMGEGARPEPQERLVRALAHRAGRRPGRRAGGAGRRLERVSGRAGSGALRRPADGLLPRRAARASRSSSARRRWPRRCCSSCSARSSSARPGRCCASSCPGRRAASTSTRATWQLDDFPDLALTEAQEGRVHARHPGARGRARAGRHRPRAPHAGRPGARGRSARRR